MKEKCLNKSDLEASFELELTSVTDKIDAFLKKSNDYLDKACDLAEEHGLSFHSNISPLSQQYGASGFLKKWMEENGIKSEENLDFDPERILEKYDCYRPEYDGWQHSAVC